MRTMKKQYTQNLPPTPCTPEMRAQVEEFAGREGKSLAEIQRTAMSLFLSRNYSKAIAKNSYTTELEHA